MSTLIDLTMHEAADLLAAGTVSSRQLCEALIERRKAVDGTIQAFVHTDDETMLAAADVADERRSRQDPLSRFDGIPVAVKDNLSVKGQPCTCASKMLQGYIAPYDATVIDAMRRRGVIIAARTNMDEFAMGSSTENSALQFTANPWDVERVPGGSSGGSAAAVASRQAIAALGSDTGGSIRQPAGFCGIVGLKPTYGRVSRYGLVAYASSLDQIGPLTRDVRDAAILMDMLCGQDPKDSTSVPDPNDSYEEALKSASLQGLRLGVPTEFFAGEGLSDDVRKVFDTFAKQIQSAGAELVDVSLPHTDAAIAAYYIIASAEASANLARFDSIRYGFRDADAEADGLLDMYRRSRARGFGAEVKRRIILGTYVLSSGYYDAYYIKAQKVRTLIRRDFDDAFQNCDLVLAPSSPTPAFRRGAMTSPLQMYLADIFTISANMAGIPGLTLPGGLTPDGLPVGIQLLAPPMAETALLKAASAAEALVGTLQLPEL